MHNIYNNIVISNTIESHLLTQLNLNNYTTLDTTLEAKPGMIVRQHTYSARGKVEDLAMGQGNTEEVEVDYISKDFEVKVVQGKGSWYDEMSATDDQLVPNLLRGMGEAMANDITEKAIAAMDSTELVHDMTNWGYHDFCDALALWPHEKEDVDFIIVHTNMVPAIRKAFDKDLRYVEDFVRYGQVGSINGVPVVASKACPENCGFMGSKKAVRTFYKRGIQMEKDRDADTRKNYIYARAVMMTYLYDATRMIKLQAGVIPPAPVGLQDIDFDVKSDIELPYVITCDEEYDSIGSVTLTVSDDSKEITLTESGEHTVDHGVYGTDTIKVSIPYEKQECEFTKDDGPHIELKPAVCEALYQVDIDITPDDVEETYTKNGDYEIDHANYGKDTIHVEIPFEQQEHEITKDSEAENVYIPTEPFEGMDEVKVNITPDPVEKEYNHEGTYVIDHGIYGEDTITVDIPTQRKEIEIHPDSLPKTIVRPDADVDFLEEVEINITPHEVEKEYTKNGEYKILHGVFGNDVIHVDVPAELTDKDILIDKNTELPMSVKPDIEDEYHGLSAVNIDLKPYNTVSEFNQNGTYVVDRGIYGVDQITIDVGAYNRLISKTFKANGVYGPEEGTDGYSQVIVDVAGTPKLQEKTVKNNGSFVPDSDYAGFSKVDVQVSPSLQNKVITENGTYTFDKGYDGMGTVTVDVEGGGGGEGLQDKTTAITSESPASVIVKPDPSYEGLSKNVINITPVHESKTYSADGEYVVDLGSYGDVNVKVNTGATPQLQRKNVMINTTSESPVHFEPDEGFVGISSGGVYITKHNTSDRYTENGTYTIDHGAFGQSTVVVDVQGAGGVGRFVWAVYEKQPDDTWAWRGYIADDRPTQYPNDGEQDGKYYKRMVINPPSPPAPPVPLDVEGIRVYLPEGGKMRFKQAASGVTAPHVLYKVVNVAGDVIESKDLGTSITSLSATIPKQGSLIFCVQDEATVPLSWDAYRMYELEGKPFEVYGDMEYLINNDLTKIPEIGTDKTVWVNKLFAASSVTKVDLLTPRHLPNNQYSHQCYGLFMDCLNLKEVTLDCEGITTYYPNNVYYMMFAGCLGIEKVDVKLGNISGACYQEMFYKGNKPSSIQDTKSLDTVSEMMVNAVLPDIEDPVEAGCNNIYKLMFAGCNIVNAEDIKFNIPMESNGNQYACQGMFVSCGKLITPPDLSECKGGDIGAYSYMFANTPLTEAPVFGRFDRIYEKMFTYTFYKCTKMVKGYSPQFGAIVPSGSGEYVTNMYNGCINLEELNDDLCENFIIYSQAPAFAQCNMGQLMFYGCSKIKKPFEYKTTTMQKGYSSRNTFGSMYQNCGFTVSNTTTAHTAFFNPCPHEVIPVPSGQSNAFQYYIFPQKPWTTSTKTGDNYYFYSSGSDSPNTLKVTYN